MSIQVRSLLLRAGASLVVLAGATSLAALQTSPRGEGAAVAALKSRRDAQLEDLAVVRSQWIPQEKALSAAERSRALRFISNLERRAGQLTPQQFYLAMWEVTSIADNGHSHAAWGRSPDAPTTRLPLRTQLFGDRLLIVRALPQLSRLAGGEILSIEGRSVPAVLAALRRYFVSAPGSATYRAPNFIEPGGLLHAAGLAQAADRLRLRIRLRDGTIVSETVAMVPSETARAPALPGSLVSPIASPTATVRWTNALEAADLPLYLQDGPAPYRAVRLPSLDAFYVQVKAGYDVGEARLADFARQTQVDFERSPTRNAIVDLRYHIGGDTGMTAELFRSIIRNTTGRIYIITGPMTLSAGMASAAILRHYAGDRAIMVGSGVGDHLRFWSETVPTCLPNSQICLIATNGLWDLQRGCEGEPGCFSGNARYGAYVPNLEPRLRAPMTIEAYLGRRDPSMEAITADLGRSAN